MVQVMYHQNIKLKNNKIQNTSNKKMMLNKPMKNILNIDQQLNFAKNQLLLQSNFHATGGTSSWSVWT
jgi:hypothetical protein